MLINSAWKRTWPGVAFFDGDPDTGINLEDPKVKAAIAAAVATETDGLKTNRDAILREKATLQEKFVEFEKRWEPLKNFDPAAIANLLSKFEKDEDAKLIAEGKLDEVLNRRTEAMRKDAETKVVAATARVSELEGSVVGLGTRIAQLVIGAKIREAAATAKVVPTAIEDVVEAGLKVYTLDANELPVIREGDGKTLVMGKDGKSPKPPSEWLEAMRETKPHWWPPSAGGGAGGSGGVDRGGKGPNLDGMSPRQKLAYGLARQNDAAA